ncbi:MAG TPA: hypothetical protein VN648_17125 [Candidatus Methylomirabilis sp.]|nr:hypothetical protein [Candidatus Methylomirabilis sp.]
MAVACPKCGFQQIEGSRCERCGFLLARYAPSAAIPIDTPPSIQGSTAPAEPRLSPSGKPAVGAFRRFYRVFRWVALAVSLIALFLLLRPATPPEVRIDPAAADHVQTKMEQMEQAVAEGRPHTLQLNEAELNVWMQSNLAMGGGPPGPAAEPTLEQVQSSLRDVKVNLIGDRVRAYALFSLYGKDVSLKLEGRLFVAEGRLRFEPISGMLGSMPIPKLSLDRAVSRLFESKDNREKFLLPPEIKDIRVINGELIVSTR